MSRIVEKTVYKFDELSPRAKERARDWFREGGLHGDWWDAVYSDAETVANILGITFDRKGGKDAEPAIYFSGFYSQGDGARFAGSYEYPKARRFEPNSSKCIADPKGKTPAKLLRDYVGGDSDSSKRIYAIADELQELQRRNFYGLTATVKLGYHGHYEHSHNTEITVYKTVRGNDAPVDAETEEAVKNALRGFMDWIWDQLRSEHEGQLSDESVDETILANEYEFDESGKRADV